MKDDQLSEFEEQARRVGRKSLPRDWRAEILEAALREIEDGSLGPETQASPFKAIVRPDDRDEGAELKPADERGLWEGRIRKAERRAMWSMAACLVASLFVIALLFRPKSEPRAARSRIEEDSAPKLSARHSELGWRPMDEHREDLRGSNKDLAVAPPLPALLPQVPPPPPPAPTVGGSAAMGLGEDAGQIEEAKGGFMIREAAINDIFQMLAKRAGKQYFHNPKVAGPDFKVSGHLDGGDPLQQMEELALAHGLSVYQKGNTVYALNEEQRSQLPAEEWNYQFGSVRPADIEKVKALIQPTLSPTGIANYEPKTNSITIVDSAHNVARARSLLTAVDQPKGPAAAGKNEENAQQGSGRGQTKHSPPAGALTLKEAVVPQSTDKAASVQNDPGKHSDGSSWGNVAIQGGVYAGKASTEGHVVPEDGSLALDRLASRKGVNLSGASSIGGVALDSIGGALPSREDYEAENAEFFPLSSNSDSALVAGLSPNTGEAIGDVEFQGQINHLGNDGSSAIRPLDLRSGVDDEVIAENIAPSAVRHEFFVNGGTNGVGSNNEDRSDPLDEAAAESRVARQVARAGQSQGRPIAISRAPLVRHVRAGTEISNQVTEEVRYSVDTKDPVGDPATTREIGVTVAVTPTLRPDGTIEMKMRPRSAQVVEEIVGQSGHRYTQPSASMLESIARVPPGHSLVVGGFYGQVKPKDGNTLSVLGIPPKINLFFKDKEAAREPSSLLLVATPTTINDRVVVETKVLSVNRRAGERTGVDWSSSLGAVEVAPETIGSLDSLFGIESTSKEVEGVNPAADVGPIVLSPAQVEGVLGALKNGGLVTQTSNPTLITEDNEQATISLIDRVPIITTTVQESEVSKEATEEIARERQRELERKRLNESEKNAGEEPYSTFSLNVSDVSFKLAKAALARGQWPAADQVRVEEFVNAFDYGDPAPNLKEKVACKLEQAAHPFLQQRNLLRVSMKTAALGRAGDTPLRLTVLLDKSGSMERADRVDSVKNAFLLLASQLNPQDQVTLIGFARTPRLLADRLAGSRVAELVRLVESTSSEGGTNLEQALELGIAKAKEQMLKEGQNRIILLTDGAANLGNARPEDLARLVESMRQQGIAFDACGVGADGLNDDILESLTRKGDGRYYFLDRPEDADNGFARQIAGALRPAARNVKVQMRFNPNRVGRYKLYGFEKHILKKEEFRDDRVDAAELAAEEAGNAIYQVELLPEGRGEIGTVSVRFQDTESGRMIEREWTIPYEAQVARIEDSAASLRLASGAALLGEKLKGSIIGESVEMARLGKLMDNLTSDFPSDQRVKELVQMTNKVRELRGE